MQWHMQSCSTTTNIKVKIDFTLHEISATKIMTCNFNVDDSSKGIYDMNLGRYLLKDLGLNLKYFNNSIEADDGPFIGFMESMVDLGTYQFKDLNTGMITPDEFLQIITQKKYMNRNKSILMLNDCV